MRTISKQYFTHPGGGAVKHYLGYRSRANAIYQEVRAKNSLIQTLHSLMEC